jgi:hypothetical protein
MTQLTIHINENSSLITGPKRYKEVVEECSKTNLRFLLSFFLTAISLAAIAFLWMYNAMPLSENMLFTALILTSISAPFSLLTLSYLKQNCLYTKERRLLEDSLKRETEGDHKLSIIVHATYGIAQDR